MGTLRAETLKVGDGEIGRLVFEPGWRWSKDVKPIAGTESCEAPHFQYHLSGRLAIKMDDGTEFIGKGPSDSRSATPLAGSVGPPIPRDGVAGAAVAEQIRRDEPADADRVVSGPERIGQRQGHPVRHRGCGERSP